MITGLIFAAMIAVMVALQVVDARRMERISAVRVEVRSDDPDRFLRELERDRDRMN